MSLVRLTLLLAVLVVATSADSPLPWTYSFIGDAEQPVGTAYSFVDLSLWHITDAAGVDVPVEDRVLPSASSIVRIAPPASDIGSDNVQLVAAQSLQMGSLSSFATDIKLNASGTPFATTFNATSWHVLSSSSPSSHSNISRITGVRPATTYIAHTSRVVIAGPMITMDDATSLTIRDIAVETPSNMLNVAPSAPPASYYTGSELHLQGFVSLPSVIDVEKTIPTTIDTDSTVSYSTARFNGGLIMRNKAWLRNLKDVSSLYTPVLIMEESTSFGLYAKSVIDVYPTSIDRRALYVQSNNSGVYATINVRDADVVLNNPRTGGTKISDWNVAGNVTIQIDNLAYPIEFNGRSDVTITGLSFNPRLIVPATKPSADYAHNGRVFISDGAIINGANKIDAGCTLLTHNARFTWLGSATVSNSRLCIQRAVYFTTLATGGAPVVVRFNRVDLDLIRTSEKSVIDTGVTIMIGSGITSFAPDTYILRDGAAILFNDSTNDNGTIEEAIWEIDRMIMMAQGDAAIGYVAGDDTQPPRGSISMTCSQIQMDDASRLKVNRITLVAGCSDGASLMLTNRTRGVSPKLMVTTGFNETKIIPFGLYSFNINVPQSLNMDVTGSVAFEFATGITIDGNMRIATTGIQHTSLLVSEGTRVAIINGGITLGRMRTWEIQGALHASSNASVTLENGAQLLVTGPLGGGSSVQGYINLKLVLPADNLAVTVLNGHIAGDYSGQGDIRIASLSDIPASHSLRLSDQARIVFVDASSRLTINTGASLVVANDLVWSMPNAQRYVCGDDGTSAIWLTGQTKMVVEDEATTLPYNCAIASNAAIAVTFAKLDLNANSTMMSNDTISLSTTGDFRMSVANTRVTFAASRLSLLSDTVTDAAVATLASSRPKIILSPCTSLFHAGNVGIDMVWQRMNPSGAALGMNTSVTGLTADGTCSNGIPVANIFVQLNGATVAAYTPLAVDFSSALPSTGEFINYAGSASIMRANDITVGASLRFSSWTNMTLGDQGLFYQSAASTLTLSNCAITCRECLLNQADAKIQPSLYLTNGTVITSLNYVRFNGKLFLSDDSVVRVHAAEQTLSRFSGEIHAANALFDIASNFQLLNVAVYGNISRPVTFRVDPPKFIPQPFQVTNAQFSRVHIEGTNTTAELLFSGANRFQNVQIARFNGGLMVSDDSSLACGNQEWNYVRVLFGNGSSLAVANIARQECRWTVNHGTWRFETHGDITVTNTNLFANGLVIENDGSSVSAMSITAKSNLTISDLTIQPPLIVRDGGKVTFAGDSKLVANAVTIGHDGGRTARLYVPSSIAASVIINDKFTLNANGRITFELNPALANGGISTIQLNGASKWSGEIEILLPAGKDTYDLPDASFQLFSTSPAHAPDFDLITLIVPRGDVRVSNNTIVFKTGVQPVRPSGDTTSAPVGAIIGGTIGGIVFLVAIVICVRRRRLASSSQSSDGNYAAMSMNHGEHA